MSNANGNYYTTPENILRALDQLPKPLRERLAEGMADWVPQVILTRYRRGYSVGSLIRLLDDWDKQEAQDHRRRLVRMAETGLDYHAKLRHTKEKAIKHLPIFIDVEY